MTSLVSFVAVAVTQIKLTEVIRDQSSCRRPYRSLNGANLEVVEVPLIEMIQ